MEPLLSCKSGSILILFFLFTEKDHFLNFAERSASLPS